MKNGPNILHRRYEEFKSRWERCRDCYEGTDRIKAKGTAYLPALGSQKNGPVGGFKVASTDKYGEYVMRALFFNATSRTVDGLSGAIFQKSPTVEVADETIEEHLEDVTMAGESLELFSLRVAREVLTTGRVGILVDMAAIRDDLDNEGEPEVDPADARPYWSMYRAEDILNWRTERKNGNQVLTRVILSEEYEEQDPGNPFKYDSRPQIRVLELRGGEYIQEVWRPRKDDDTEWDRIEELTPTRRGEVLDFIPFVFIGPTSTSPEVARPPLLDLVDVNLDHYRIMADLRHGQHYTALPTPVITGQAAVDAQGNAVQLSIGSSTAWILPDPQASAIMLEYKGEGLGALEKAEEVGRKMMATLGARLLEAEPKVQETAQAVGMRHAGEHATLRTVAQSIESALTLAVRWHAWWFLTADRPEELEDVVELNKEFFATRMSFQDLQAWVAAFQADSISFDTFYAGLVRGDLARPGIDVEEEKKALEAEVTARMERMIESTLLTKGDPNADPENPDDEDEDEDEDEEGEEE